MNSDILIWTAKTLEGEYGTYLYNILLQYQNLLRLVEREKTKPKHA